MRHASRSNGWLRLEASHARISQSSLKTGGGVAWMVHVASSRRSRGDEAEDGRVDVMGCIEFFYPNFVVFIVLDHKNGLVISFPINRIPMVDGEDQIFSHSSSTPSYSCFLRSVDVFHGVREERRERSLETLKEWGDIVVIFTSCKLLICINISVFLYRIISFYVLKYFSFSSFSEVFLVRFSFLRFEESFFTFFHGKGC
jgi:hypothetical protein